MITNLLGSLTVEMRAIIGVAALLLVLVILIGLTSLVIRFRNSVILWLFVLAAFLAYTMLMPVETESLASQAHPESEYAAAVDRFEREKARNAEPLNPLCPSQLLTHGQKTDRVVVLFHGVSSCPQAFVDFAPILFEEGANVLIVRMPQNGFADRATDALKNLTAEQLREMGDVSVDIAAGLGEEVVVVGISAGGTVAAWAGQNRPEVDRVVLLAPFFGLANFGPQINLALMRAMLVLPHFSIWKDPVLREQFEGMPHAYQRQSTRATGEIMRLGLAVYRQAEETAPAAKQAAIVTNAADTAVDNSITQLLADAWAAHGMDVVRYEFPASDELGHELIDPLEPGANPELTYPLILQMIDDPSTAQRVQ
ncbi:alpha/beta fold hydrolase [Acuticoccus sp. M5D2P5]|uniref:alpha/beta hydrolase n=1 Tax=Acuticoccus kalidii TaxID=2910977 RepID=UPI001F1B168C|nr:alpha/beta fold hydrolase [Acuticoccus kalidii]MCF3933694.1 alpha/beta fold hydrolase [Acuticoccus kalidii]